MQKLLLLAVLTGALSACGWSPLFNHRDARAHSTPQVQPSSANCPIPLTKLSLCASLSWQELPVAEEKPGSLTLDFWTAGDSARSPVDPEGTVRVAPWMPSMGHGSMVAKTARLRQGAFEVKEVVISMGGAWQIKVQIRDGGTVIDEAFSDEIEF